MRIASHAFSIVTALAAALRTPVVLASFFRRSTGEQYGIGLASKLSLFMKMRRNYRKITSASHYIEHLIMATQIMNIPKHVEGCVVECGCYKGGSTANLSLVCALCNRQLEVFDSFQGLPEPADWDESHHLTGLSQVHTYSKGSWAGTTKEVRTNIIKYGDINVVSFNEGFFEETLPHFKKRCAFIFLDVDLTESIQTCIKWLWPLLGDGCYVFSHEASHYEISRFFYDKEWWLSLCASNPPGLIGAGSGLGLFPAAGGFRSDIGYTVKNPPKGEVCPQVGTGTC